MNNGHVIRRTKGTLPNFAVARARAQLPSICLEFLLHQLFIPHMLAVSQTLSIPRTTLHSIVHSPQVGKQPNFLFVHDNGNIVQQACVLLPIPKLLILLGEGENEGV